jgi:hypothetical protein
VKSRQTNRCTNEKLQTWLDSFPDIESFIGDREPLNDTPDENGRLKYAWYEPPELYEDCRAAAGWDWSRVDTTNLEISRGCGLDRRNEWRKVLLAWDDTRC